MFKSSIFPEKRGTQSNLDPEIPTLDMEARKCNEKLDIQAASFQFKKRGENTRSRRGTVPWSWECYLKVDEVKAEEALTKRHGSLKVEEKAERPSCMFSIFKSAKIRNQEAFPRSLDRKTWQVESGRKSRTAVLQAFGFRPNFWPCMSSIGRSLRLM